MKPYEKAQEVVKLGTLIEGDVFPKHSEQETIIAIMSRTKDSSLKIVRQVSTAETWRYFKRIAATGCCVTFYILPISVAKELRLDENERIVKWADAIARKVFE